MRIIFPHLTYVILSAHTLNFWIYRYEIKHPEIVYAQAMLESMWMNCSDCSLDKNNNIFGFSYDGKTYKNFDHWTESVQFYKSWQADYIGCSDEDYYEFLRQRWKAPNMEEYINKLKWIKKNIATVKI